MKVLTIVGARPQFIKAATISRVISQRSDVEEVIVHTGQHFDENMSEIFFTEMNIPKPHYNLAIASLGHGAMTGRMLEKIEEVLLIEQPDWVLVYGDTNSTLAGALAASKLHINVAHVEAGLRSFNMRMPEEQNRLLTDRISTLLFSPTQVGIDNLLGEGFTETSGQLLMSGDVMYDAALYYQDLAKPPQSLSVELMQQDFILATIHRAENTNDPQKLSAIVTALNTIHQTTPVVLPLHPRTKQIIEKNGLSLDVHCIDPVGYLEMVYLLSHCKCVASDSGGVQKEAYFFGKQCIILREETEWMELVEHGANYIVGSQETLIVDKYNTIMSTSDNGIDFTKPFYGNGKSAEYIVDAIVSYAE